jgi:PAS domain S-box-containing protein
MVGRRGRAGWFPWASPLIIAEGILAALLAGATGAAAQLPALGTGQLEPSTALDATRYTDIISLLVAVLLLQSVAVALLWRRLRRRRETEALLRESEERFRLLVENSLVAVYMVDGEGIIRYANRTLCAMFGYQQDDLRGKLNFRSLIHPDDLPRIADNFSKRLSGAELPARYEASGLHRNGDLIEIEILSAQTCLAGNSFVIGSLLDISKRKRFERLMQHERLQREEMNLNLELRVQEELERSREKDKLMLQQSRFAAMGEMIGNIAHQWRQPLNKLGIVMQLLQMEQEKGAMTNELMEQRVESGMGLLLGLSRTIDDFRNFFRPEMAAAPFSLSGAVRKTVGFFEASCADCGIKISIEGESERIYDGHVNQFCQALLNILINARDALLETGAGQPLIVVGMRDEELRSVLTVWDNAGGIDPAIIGKIFDPYFTTRGKGNRTGIGLYMAKTIIDQNMRGRIFARNFEGGAEFRIVV